MSCTNARFTLPKAWLSQADYRNSIKRFLEQVLGTLDETYRIVAVTEAFYRRPKYWIFGR